MSRRLRTVRLDGARHRLALVDIERAAIVEHQIEIVIAAEGVVPRQPVDQHRRLVGEETRSPARIIAWLAHSMRWVLMTPLGWPVEPEVNRILAMVSGPTLACAASTAGVGLRAEVRERRRRPVARRVCGDRPLRRRAARPPRWRARRRCRRRRRRGPASGLSMMALSLPKSCDSSEYGTEIGA